MSDDGDPEQVVNARQQDLVLALTRLQSELGRLPRTTDIDDQSQYSADDYATVFGDLYTAYRQVGLIPDSVTSKEFRQQVEAEPNEAESDESTSKSSPADPTPNPTAVRDKYPPVTLEEVRYIVEASDVDIQTLVNTDDSPAFPPSDDQEGPDSAE